MDDFIEQPRLTLADKTRLWREHCTGFASWDPTDQRRLTGSYRLNAGQIVAIGNCGGATAAEAADLAREATRSDLGDLGRLLTCGFRWDDIVLKAPAIEALRDLAYEAQERAEFWENPEARRLFPCGTGLTALFTGEPGTGKTMAAQIIAAELQLDLYRIDLARVAWLLRLRSEVWRQCFRDYGPQQEKQLAWRGPPAVAARHLSPRE